MNLGLKGKPANVSGGNRGIRSVNAHTFACGEVRSVIAAGTNDKRGYQVVNEIEDAVGVALMIKTDVSKLEETERLAGITLEEFGKIGV